MLPARGYAGRAGRLPMVLQMHGGPHGAYGNTFSFDQQLLAGQGYMVLFTNPRASTGYGEDFRWGTWGGWGFNDYDDVMAGVDHAIENYDIDTARMGVTGYSYGGYLTNWVITHTDRFAAAIAGASISNWVSDYGVADIPRTKESEFFGPPWEERGLENLLRSSPIIHAKGVTTPTPLRPRGIRPPGPHRGGRADVRGAPEAAGAREVRALSRLLSRGMDPVAHGAPDVGPARVVGAVAASVRDLRPVSDPCAEPQAP